MWTWKGSTPRRVVAARGASSAPRWTWRSDRGSQEEGGIPRCSGRLFFPSPRKGGGEEISATRQHEPVALRLRPGQLAARDGQGTQIVEDEGQLCRIDHAQQGVVVREDRIDGREVGPRGVLEDARLVQAAGRAEVDVLAGGED